MQRMDNLKRFILVVFWGECCARSVYLGRTYVAEMIPILLMHAKKGKKEKESQTFGWASFQKEQLSLGVFAGGENETVPFGV